MAAGTPIEAAACSLAGQAQSSVAACCTSIGGALCVRNRAVSRAAALGQPCNRATVHSPLSNLTHPIATHPYPIGLRCTHSRAYQAHSPSQWPFLDLAPVVFKIIRSFVHSFIHSFKSGARVEGRIYCPICSVFLPCTQWIVTTS